MPDVPLSPEEEQRINAHWGEPLGGSAGGLPPPEALPPVSAIDSGGGPGAPIMSAMPQASPQAPPAMTFGGAPNMSVAPPYGPVNPETQILNYYSQGSGGDSGGGMPVPGPAIGAPPPQPPPHVPNALNLDPAIRQGASLSMGPQVPKGPSDDDNTAFAAHVANLSRSKPLAARGGGAVNADPYGIDAAQKGQLASFDDQMSAMRRAQEAAAVRAVKQADAVQRFARVQEEDAAIDRASSDLAQSHYDEGMREIGRQLDDVRSKKVDPFRLMKEQPALGVLAVIGGALSGFYQGITGGQQNQFLTDLDHQLDRAQVEDERQIRDNKFAIEHGINLLAQQRAVQKDNDLARMQSRNLQYEAVKQQIAAEAASDSVPIDKAQTDELIAQVAFKQKQLQEEIGRRKKAQSDAAANQAFAAQKEVLATYNNFFDKVMAATQDPEQAEFWASRQVARMYAPGTVGPLPHRAGGSDPVMSVPKGRRDEAAKEFANHSNAEKSVSSVDSAFEKWRDLPITAGPWDRDREALAANILAAYKSGLGPGMSSDQDAIRFLDPLMPKTGDSDATLKNKQALIASSIRSKVSTPTLDAHVPGWRPPSDAEREAQAARVKRELNGHTFGRGK